MDLVSILTRRLRAFLRRAGSLSNSANRSISNTLPAKIILAGGIALLSLSAPSKADTFYGTISFTVTSSQVAAFSAGEVLPSGFYEYSSPSVDGTFGNVYATDFEAKVYQTGDYVDQNGGYISSGDGVDWAGGNEPKKLEVQGGLVTDFDWSEDSSEQEWYSYSGSGTGTFALYIPNSYDPPYSQSVSSYLVEGTMVLSNPMDISRDVPDSPSTGLLLVAGLALIGAGLRSGRSFPRSAD